MPDRQQTFGTPVSFHKLCPPNQALVMQGQIVLPDANPFSDELRWGEEGKLWGPLIRGKRDMDRMHRKAITRIRMEA